MHYYFAKNKGAAKNEVLNFITSQLLKFSCQMCCTQLIPISSITSISCFSALSEVTTLLSVMTRPTDLPLWINPETILSIRWLPTRSRKAYLQRTFQNPSLLCPFRPIRYLPAPDLSRRLCNSVRGQTTFKTIAFE